MIFDGRNPTDKFLIVVRDGVGVIGMVESIDTDKDEIVRFVKEGNEFKRVTERWSDGFHGSYRAP